MFIVRVAGVSDPTASEREVVEERPRCERGLKAGGKHQDRNKTERDVFDAVTSRVDSFRRLRCSHRVSMITADEAAALADPAGLPVSRSKDRFSLPSPEKRQHDGRVVGASSNESAGGGHLVESECGRPGIRSLGGVHHATGGVGHANAEH